MTSHEFKHSGLLFAFEMLLTRTPRQIQVAADKRRAVKNAQHEEEFKNSELIGASSSWDETEATDVVNEKEGRCVMNRLKFFAHVFLRRAKGVLPMRSLIELSHTIIAESDAAFSRMPGTGAQASGLFGDTHLMPPIGFSGHKGNRKGDGGSEYEQYLNALRHLQKRVTINMVYDPKKNFDKEKSDTKKLEVSKAGLGGLAEVKEEAAGEKDAEGDSIMEELDESKPPSISFKKSQSMAPAMHNLAASPNKDGTSQSSLHQSKVHLMRHLLFRTMKNSHVSVEQSSCMQVLEDFLRNQVRSMDDVKRLKQREYDGSGGMPSEKFGALFGNFGGRFGGPSLAPGAVRLSNFFDLAFDHIQ